MMFWFKPRKVYVDCFTTLERTYNQFAPAKAANFIPEWWKKLPEFTEERIWNNNKHTKPSTTMKHCTGFRDLYFKGFIIPLWADLKITVNESAYYYSFADEFSEVKEHEIRQHGNSYPNFHHMKIISPWFIKEKSGVKFAFTEPTWSFLHSNLYMHVLPGVVRYDLNTQTNINIFLPKKDQTALIEAGHPMVHLIPLTDKTLIVKKHLVSSQELLRISTPYYRAKFYNDFGTYRKFMGKDK